MRARHSSIHGQQEYSGPASPFARAVLHAQYSRHLPAMDGGHAGNAGNSGAISGLGARPSGHRLRRCSLRHLTATDGGNGENAGAVFGLPSQYSGLLPLAPSGHRLRRCSFRHPASTVEPASWVRLPPTSKAKNRRAAQGGPFYLMVEVAGVLGAPAPRPFGAIGFADVRFGILPTQYSGLLPLALRGRLRRSRVLSCTRSQTRSTGSPPAQLPKPKNRKATARVAFLFLVEVAGVEPASESAPSPALHA